MIIQTPAFTILWGDASQAVNVKELEAYRQGNPLIDNPWDLIRKQVPSLENFFFVHQVHGAHGYNVTEPMIQRHSCWTLEGDYLLTNVPGVGIGVLTADCLPIVVYDSTFHACAAIHAGWRSSVAGIVAKAISHMNKTFGSSPENLQLFLGPCAGLCCYSIGGQIITALADDVHLVTEKRNDDIYFDLAGYSKLQAEKVGTPQKSIDLTNQTCTICNTQFCSYRREKEGGNRQISLICLNKF